MGIKNIEIKKEFIKSNFGGSLILCERCRKPLIERLPNGLWKFKFGRASLSPEKVNRKILSLRELLNEILKIREDLQIRSHGIDDRLLILEHLIDLCPQTETSVDVEVGVLNNGDEVFNRLINRINFKVSKLYSRRGWIPVIMYIHGSIKMRCFRKDCEHWNILNFLPYSDTDLFQSI